MNKKIYFVLAVIILIAALLVGGFFVFRTKFLTKSYSVVYLSTCEIYIGRLSRFPRLQLGAAYLLHTAQDPNDPAKNNFQISPLSDALWAPQTLYLNREHIIFFGPLSDTSKVAEALHNKK